MKKKRRKRKEHGKEDKRVKENIKTDISLNVYVICFGDPISMARREKKETKPNGIIVAHTYIHTAVKFR